MCLDERLSPTVLHGLNEHMAGWVVRRALCLGKCRLWDRDPTR